MNFPHCICVRGARSNNLRDVTIDIPKHALTVFTGVSGSGKSSLVFDTIAAESQRLVNETYPGFVQGFMPSLARPDVDYLGGLTAAIIVGQEPMAANARSTFGTATDIVGLLRILYSRAAQPAAGGPAAYSFNVPSVSSQGGMSVNGKATEVVRFERTGGMCPECEGLGRANDIDLSAVVDESLSLNEGAILLPGHKVDSWSWKAYAQSGLYPADVPVAQFTPEQKHALYYLDDVKVKVAGVNMSYLGVVPRMRQSMLSKDPESLKKHVREFVQRAVRFVPCPACGGTRLAEHVRNSFLNGLSLAEVCELELPQVRAWASEIADAPVAPLVSSLTAALDAAIDLGLGYLTLSRPAGSLSGGEAQRTRMVRHMGSALTDVTYVFDEPTSGLHPHDIDRVNRLLLALRDKGNTVLVVEHKPQTIAIADYVVDMGPAAGSLGGEVVFAGTVEQLRGADTVTGRHLADAAQLKSSVRSPRGQLQIVGAASNNLRDVDLEIPVGVLTAVTGVAGSGKTSLLAHLPELIEDPARVLRVDQGAVKGSRRSNPATYTGALDSLRKAFAKANGVSAALFSANSEGACPACNGAGVVYVDLGVMSGVDVPCDVCEGRRFAQGVLDYRLGGLSIADVLDLPAARAAEFCADNRIGPAAKICRTLVQVGLGYVTLGQPLTTLSGGEQQRLKLAAHLHDKKSTADILVLDEPSTGLHPADVTVLLELLDVLVDQGNTVIVVEHNLAVIAHVDYVIDLGPGAGSAGGTVVAEGTPAQLVQQQPAHSLTAQYLARYLDAPPAQP
ncbi:excinuclease ABC subunit UvrA [Corynebacterium lizhenjunii]|uniref:UvrABC system protein A n=1 Tax=Corynebacterium lizhenjunii TaxID=2709394 RepID=A0A7T0KFW1_9CORY|nr:excinuclease ABC subunit UvrA [Corynebacterium lizhenjunii]QPK79616.1 excinuclease ABC subunit UvrA [Corynebacterium lizhenjunii]